VLAAVTKASEDDLIERLRAAVDAGLLVEAEPDVFGFHHEIAREAIEGGLLGRERRRLHEAALAALQESGSQDYVSIVHHARAAGRYDEMVEAARVGAHESLARGSTFQALQLAEAGLDEAEDDLDLLSVAARAAWLADILDDTVALAARWLELARERAGAGEVAAALSLSMRVAFEMGDLEAMAAFTDQLMATVDDVPDPGDRGRAMATIAQSWMLREHVAETTAWADRALALAEEHGLDDVRIAAMVEKGSMLSYSTQQDPEAYAYLRAAAEEAERAGENLLAARAYSNLVWNARGWRDADEGRALVDRMVARAEAAGFGAATADRSMVLAQIAATEGDLDRARAHLEEMDEPAHRRAGLAKGRWMAVLRAGLALEAGDLEAAERYAAAAKPATERTRSGVTGLDMHLAIRHGDLDTARRHLADLLEAAEAEGSASIGQAHDLMSVGLPAGLTAAEMRPLVALAGYYAGHRLAPGDPWRSLLEAQLAENEGRVEEAAEGYARAAGGLGRSLNVLAGRRGSAHVGAARMLVALGRLDDARAHVRLAQPLLARWRSWRVAELRAVERRLGLGDEPSGPEALTPREREVAALLAQGLTNAQLADRLFISPRTAAVHVSNILAKLGMGSRTEVAAWAASGGLAPAAAD
jgi:DNA-binding CsgD family transcriptional regulator/tetratricopeptide (TPR) repeat protein